MTAPVLSSSRRRFLRAFGLLAATSPAIAGAAPLGAGISEPDWLKKWNDLPRQPVRETHDHIIQSCLNAASRGAKLSLYYHGGSTPGRLRKFSPELVFRLPNRETTYVSGYCHLRQAPRILRADRISPA